MEIADLLFVITALQLAAAIVASITFSKYRFSNERYFLYFLWYTFAVDVIGATLGYGFSLKNFWVYNAYTISSFLFYFYWYYTILKSKNFKRTIVVFTGIFLVVAIVSLFYQSWLEYHSYSFNVGALFVLVLTLFHFYQLLKSDEILIVKYKLSFWISTALLLFYMGMIPLFSLSSFIKFRGASYILILLGLNIILYGCYIIGFLWTNKKYNRF